MNDLQKYLSKSLLVTAALLLGASPAWAQTAPSLGTASSFAVLSAAPSGGGAVTCTDSTITGDVGSSGLPALVTQTSCNITGAIVAPVPAQVLTDFNSAYAALADNSSTSTYACTETLDSTITGPRTLYPGVYCTDAALTGTGVLTLDAQGDANAVWIFKIGTGGTGALTGTNFSVVMANGAQPCNVYWWVAQAVTMTTSGFQGTILAGAAITMTGLASPTTRFNGDALAKDAVTLTNFYITSCAVSGGGKPYSKLTFAKSANLTTQERKHAQKQSNDLKPLLLATLTREGLADEDDGEKAIDIDGAEAAGDDEAKMF